MVPLGDEIRNNAKIALHSDASMAPLNPITLARTTLNRSTIKDNANATAHALTVEQALRAITIDAVWMMNMEDQIGSIRSGKKQTLWF